MNALKKVKGRTRLWRSIHVGINFCLALLLLGQISACPGTPVDPLAQERQRLLALRDLPLEQNWPAHAALYVSEASLAEVLQRALTQNLAAYRETLTLNAPMGLVFSLTPEIDVAALRVTQEQGLEADCVAVEAELSGHVDLALGRDGQSQALNAPVQAKLKSVAKLYLQRRDDGKTVLMAKAQQPELWRAEIQLGGLPSAWNLGLSQSIEENLRNYLLSHPLPASEVVALDRQGPVQVRGLRLRGVGQGVFAIDLHFEILDAPPLRSQPVIHEGVALFVPEATVLALARAAALRTPAQEGLVVEPFRIELREKRWQLWVRLWQVAARPSARTFLVAGTFGLDPQGQLQVHAESARELGSGGRRIDPLSLISRAAILHQLQQSLQAALPAHIEQKVLGQTLRSQASRISAVDGALVVYAQLQVLPANVNVVPKTN